MKSRPKLDIETGTLAYCILPGNLTLQCSVDRQLSVNVHAVAIYRGHVSRRWAIDEAK